VKSYLVKKGVGDNRIQSVGHGPSDPIADNKTVAGRARNRRVEVKLDYQ
jgi:OOP family OmpA-OmpF porin